MLLNTVNTVVLADFSYMLQMIKWLCGILYFTVDLSMNEIDFFP